MKRKHYEEFTRTERQLAEETCLCDVCKKIIYKRSFKPGDIKSTKTFAFWRITTGHNDWGNDSPDSVETYDVCSTDCIRKKMEEYIDITCDGVNSQYINIEHVCGLMIPVLMP